jgi:hypothetical protein
MARGKFNPRSLGGAHRLHSYCNANRDGNTHCDANRNLKPHGHSDADHDCNAYGHSDFDGNRDRDCNPNQDCNADYNSDRNGHEDCDVHGNPDFDRDSDGDRNGHEDGDSNCHIDRWDADRDWNRNQDRNGDYNSDCNGNADGHRDIDRDLDGDLNGYEDRNGDSYRDINDWDANCNCDRNQHCNGNSYCDINHWDADCDRKIDTDCLSHRDVNDNCYRDGNADRDRNHHSYDYRDCNADSDCVGDSNIDTDRDSHCDVNDRCYRNGYCDRNYDGHADRDADASSGQAEDQAEIPEVRHSDGREFQGTHEHHRDQPQGQQEEARPYGVDGRSQRSSRFVQSDERLQYTAGARREVRDQRHVHAHRHRRAKRHPDDNGQCGKRPTASEARGQGQVGIEQVRATAGIIVASLKHFSSKGRFKWKFLCNLPPVLLLRFE